MKRLVAVAMMVMSAGAAAQINKCVDKSGKVVGYGYECQPGTTPQASGVKAAPPPPAAPAAGAAAASPGGASPAAPKSTAERDADFRKRQMEKQEASAKDDKKAAAAAQNQRACEESRAYLKSLQSGNRITRTDPKTGDRVFLADTDYSAEIARTQKTLDTHCK